ncbi:sunset domain-containing protein [Paracoccus versutus]
MSNKGERIYHTPWSPAHAKTRIDESRGERWFCDEAEAIAAGWRAARWR